MDRGRAGVALSYVVGLCTIMCGLALMTIPHPYAPASLAVLFPEIPPDCPPVYICGEERTALSSLGVSPYSSAAIELAPIARVTSPW